MSITLTAAELSEIRSAINDLMPDTCNLLTNSATADGYGGITSTWGTAVASVPCRLDGIKGNEQLAGGAIMPFHTYVMTFPSTAVVTEANRIQHGGYTYQVRSVDLDKSWIASVRAYVERE
jgi:head-tail adaptor